MIMCIQVIALVAAQSYVEVNDMKSDSVRLGKTVFLTREEAEKALEESEDNA